MKDEPQAGVPDEGPDELTVRLHSTTDAMVWAQEWCKVAVRLVAEGKTLIDEGWMVGWFANAIMVGYDEGHAKGMRDASAMLGTDTDDGRGREFTL